MNIFRNYFRIVKQHKTMLFIYTLVFLVMVFFFAKAETGDVKQSYVDAKSKVYIIDDSNSTLSKGLTQYLEEKEEIITGIDAKNIEDELFYGLVDVVVHLPENFEKEKKVEFKTTPKSSYGKLTQQRINEYLQKIDLYEKAGVDEKTGINYAMEDLNTDIKVDRIGEEPTHTQGAEYYFNFLSYVLMAQTILIISFVMSSYEKKVIAMRNEVSPVSNISINTQLILGHLFFGVITWLLYIVIFGVFWPAAIQVKSVQLMVLNSFIFMLVSVAMGMAINALIPNEDAQSVVFNVITLASAFLGGAFVPQELLGNLALNIGRIFPTYYFVKNNQILVNHPSLQDITGNLIILIGFIVLYSGLLFLKPILKKRI